MKSHKLSQSFLFILLALIVFADGAAFGQRRSFGDAPFAAERRPFDFADKTYISNGVQAELLIDRRNGSDRRSVFGFINDPIYRSVRITEVMPAYAADGAILFWNHHADLPKTAFTPDADGAEAEMTATRYPIFMFPSENVKHSDRQSALIETDIAYFDKNPLGIGVVYIVKFTSEIETDAGRKIVDAMAARNGRSLDGTAIIRTIKDLGELSRERLVTIVRRADAEPDRTSYIVGRIMRDPATWAIAPDAFLTNVTEPDGKPLAAEAFFESEFNCLQTTGQYCNKE